MLPKLMLSIVAAAATMLCSSIFAADARTLVIAAGAQQRGFEVERSFRGIPDAAGEHRRHQQQLGRRRLLPAFLCS